MAVAAMTGTMLEKRVGHGGRGREIVLAIPPHYEKMADNLGAKLAAYAERKGKPAELEIRIEWHYGKRSFDQLQLLWVLLGKAAAIAGCEAQDLYDSYLEDYGPRVEVLISPEAEGPFREQFHRVVSRDERGKWVYLKAIAGASVWNTKQASEAIDYWFQQLAELGVDAESAVELAYSWKQWRLAMSAEGVDVSPSGAGITQQEYKLRTPLCEGCGDWVGAGGELAHIVARGMGGNETGIANSPHGWLHLCTKCHRDVQHQKGWEALLKRAPWLRAKVERALTGGTNVEADDGKAGVPY